MGLPLPVAMGLWILLGIGIMVVIVIGISRRRQDGVAEVPELAAIPPTPAGLGNPLTQALPATYVSSTRSGDWLARLGAFGLGHRAQAVVQVWEQGVAIERLGEVDFFIPRASLRGVTTADGMAGKFVGHQGLDVVSWQVADGPLAIDTGLRLHHSVDRALLRDAVIALLHSENSTTPTTKESA